MNTPKGSFALAILLAIPLAACASSGSPSGSGTAAVPAHEAMAFSDSLDLVPLRPSAVISAELDEIGTEQRRMERRLPEIRDRISETEAMIEIHEKEAELAEAREELEEARGNESARVNQRIQARLQEARGTLLEQRLEVAEAELAYVEKRLEALRASRDALGLEQRLVDDAARRSRQSRAQDETARAAAATARHEAEGQFLREWASYAELQREAAERFDAWLEARVALIEARGEIIGSR